MSEMLICKDCKYAKWRPWYLYSWRCHNRFVPKRVEIDPVTGPSTIGGYYESCITMRFDGDNKCGKEAKFWQPKHKKDLFKLIVKESS